MDPDLARSLLIDLLSATVQTLDDPPERQYVGHGNFAHDCELIAVQILSIRTETAELGRGTQSCALVPVFTLQVTVMRCYPAVDGEGIPNAAQLTAASLLLADDSVALSGGLLARWEQDNLFPSAGPHCDRVEIGFLEPVGPGGGTAGWRITFDVRT